MDFTAELNGHTLEYIDNGHLYIVDGVIVPSVSEILNFKFGGKYDRVSSAVLQRAADKGTAVHEAIEKYCYAGEITEIPEVRNFRFLERQYGFTVKETEKPILIFFDDEPIAAGRFDLVLSIGDQIGGADIKRTATLDKERLAYQLNLYRIGYRQTYGIEWEFLKGIHLRENTRKFVDIPINENMAWQLIHEYRGNK